MAKRRLFLALLLGALLAWWVPAFSTPALALSDADYKKMMRDPEFAQADKALNAAWKEAKSSLSGAEFEALKRDQRAWVKSGRDAEAKKLMKKLPRVKAYAAATNARADYILQLARGIPDEEGDDWGDDWPEEAVAQAVNQPEATGARDDDLPNDFPDDLPDDVPADEPQRPAPAAQKAAAKKQPAPTTPEEAASALEARLMQLDRLSPSETLSYRETTDVNGENCWVFVAQSEGLGSIVETGRYAVSANGRLYELEGKEWKPLK